jgi:hypothetical protein
MTGQRKAVLGFQGGKLGKIKLWEKMVNTVRKMCYVKPLTILVLIRI